MTARSLRDMKGYPMPRTRLGKLQREADAQRREAHMEARQILSQSIYRAWQFFKAPVDMLQQNKKAKASKEVDSSRDSLLTAIAVGRLNKEQVSQYELTRRTFTIARKHCRHACPAKLAVCHRMQWVRL